jgi:hypothetical protein
MDRLGECSLGSVLPTRCGSVRDGRRDPSEARPRPQEAEQRPAKKPCHASATSPGRSVRNAGRHRGPGERWRRHGRSTRQRGLDVCCAAGRSQQGHLCATGSRLAAASGHARLCRQGTVVRAAGLQLRDGRAPRRATPAEARHLLQRHATLPAAGQRGLQLHSAQRHLQLLPCPVGRRRGGCGATSSRPASTSRPVRGQAEQGRPAPSGRPLPGGALHQPVHVRPADAGARAGGDKLPL